MTIVSNELIEILSRPENQNSPWMTARMIARKMALSESRASDIETCLHDYFKHFKKNGQPQIRYSNLPSKNTLELLWAHTKFVGMRELNSIYRTDFADRALQLEIDNYLPSVADVFISHSFKDYDHVIQIAKSLQKKAVSPWLAETHIGYGDNINYQVISALNNSKSFVFFLSENSLLSKWSSKELSYAHHRQIKVLIVADCTSDIIRTLIDKFINQKAEIQNSLPKHTAELFKTIFSSQKLFADENSPPIVLYPKNNNVEHRLLNDKKIVFQIHELPALLKNPN